MGGRTWGVRAATVALAVGVASVALSGCVRTACPAIGWINTVSITTTDSRVADVVVCAGGECSAPAALMSTAEPTAVIMVSVEPKGDGDWVARLGMSTPHTITVTALDAAGAVIDEREEPLTWRRVGGTARCGGPGEAGPIRIG